jgi:hypothetical protein
MSSPKKIISAAAMAASAWLAAPHLACALSSPANVPIDGGPLGELQLTGGVEGYGYYQTPTATGQKSNGALLGETLVQLQKNSGLVQYTVAVASYNGSTTLGTAPVQASIVNLTTGPLYQAYVTIAPANAPFTVSVGQVGGLDGYEGAFAWNNPSQFVTALYYVENGTSRGVSGTYASGPIAATVTFSDGWDTGVFNWLQAQATYTFNASNSLTLFYGGNLGTIGPNAHLLGNAQVKNYTAGPNSQMLGYWYTYTQGNLMLLPEVQGQYARANTKAGIFKPTWNLGAAVLADYSFGTSPYSVGGWVEYFTSHSATVDNFNWFVGPDSQAVGATLSPTWAYKDLFARANFGYIYLLHHKDAMDGGYGFGNSAGAGLFQGTLEAGLEF